MNIDNVAAQYMKLQPNLDRIVKPETNSVDSNLSKNKSSDGTLNTKSAGNQETAVTSESKLSKLLDSEEKKTIAKLFGSDGMAKLNQLLDKNDGRISDLPRGILVNVKI